jgi:peroxiredoxin
MSRIILAILLSVSFSVSPLLAGKFNRKISVGDTAPGFNNLEATDGKKYGLDDFKDKDLVVLVITCNECPVAQSYEDRIMAFAKKYKDKVAVVALNVNGGEDEELPKMKDHAEKKGFNFVYVRDPEQKIGRALGASKTPEFFVLSKERKIAYMGAFDDELNPAKVTEKYLESAVEAILKGEKPAKAETPAYGCGIEYRRVKK